MKKALLSSLIIALVLAAATGGRAQTICLQMYSLPKPGFTSANSIPLVNTQGNWVADYSASPNDIQNLETEIRNLPRRGLGVKAVEFKLVGADGGTAQTTTQIVGGGRGSQVQFTVPIDTLYGKLFIVTYGKHGQNTSVLGTFGGAGGGGSTGMAWLVPWQSPVFHQVAVAAGGGGAFGGGVLTSAGIGGDYTCNSALITCKNIRKNSYTNTCDQSLTVYAGASQGSTATPDNGTETESFCSNMVSYSTTPILGGLYLTKFTFGQTGGVTHSVLEQNGTTSNVNSTMIIPSMNSNCGSIRTGYGGKGGSGFLGGGAGADGFSDFEPNEEAYPGGGGGGTGGFSAMPGYPGVNGAGHGGQSFYNPAYISAVTITGGVNPVATPQSGSFWYRTIADDIAPVVALKADSLYLTGNSVTLSWSEINNGSYDNDSIAFVTFSKSTFTCADLGYNTVIVYVTDFAGNTAMGLADVYVFDKGAPVSPTGPLSVPRNIDITNGPHTLVQSDFPVCNDPCLGNNVTYQWAAQTFTCANLGTSVAVNYTVTDALNNSAVFSQVFNIVSGNTANVYVDASATGANNGSSWADAFTNLQDAFTHVCNDRRNIYIATGTYYPDRGTGITLNNRSATFNIRNGDKIYGGFPSGGAVFSQRDSKLYPTVISGNIGNTSLSTDNSYHVLTIPAGVTGILLDGIAIADGRGDENPSSFGGGIKMASAFADSIDKVTLKNCVLVNNYAVGNGGAMGFPNVAFAGLITAINSSFTGNTAGGNGGVLYSSNASIPSFFTSSFTNCIFMQNTASNGGVLYSQNTASLLVNCSSANNKAGVSGGALVANTANIHARNCIFWGDTAGNVPNVTAGPGQYLFTYCNVQGSGGSSSWNNNTGINNGMNIDSNPQYFSFPPLLIPPSSPCRNAGLKTLNNSTTDFAGTQRVVQDTIDMGAYEINPIVYVAADAPNGGDGNNWATALNNLNTALDSANKGYYLKEIWIKKGTYKPDRNGSTDQGRFNTFGLRGSEKLYGGFAGTETAIAQRDIPANPTILDGDIGTVGDTSDNAYHVVTINASFPGLDGLIIQNGNANHPTLAAYQTGGAVYDAGYTAEPTPFVRNCVFRNNSAYSGGAISVANASTNYTFSIVQSLFYNNYAKFYGGALYVQNGGSSGNNVTCNLYHCTGANNIANGFGGGFVETININGSGTAVTNFYNSTVWGNRINQNGSSYLLQDYNNTNSGAITNIYGSHVGGANPDFVNMANPAGADGLIMTTDDGLSLQPSSAAVNAGNNANIYDAVATDITGSERILQGTVDAGAYETFGCLGLTTIYVDSSVTASGTGDSWSTAYKYLSEALKTANSCPLVQNIKIAKGTYYPSGTNEFWASRDTAFYISRPYNLYGGYPTGGGVQNAKANQTILSGDINSTVSTDNTYHILIIKAGTTDTTILDGLAFAKGNASQNGFYTLDGTTYSRSSGGAVVATATKLHINNCNFTGNSAFQGGAAVYSTGGTINSYNSIFEKNSGRYGGALRIEGSGTTPVAEIVSNIFYGNTATTLGGGAISLFNGSSTIANNLFAFDSCLIVQEGGAVNITGGKSFVSGNTFYKSYANSSGGGALAINSTADTQFVANNIFYGNTNTTGVNHYAIGGTVVSGLIANSIGGNPQFRDTANLKGADNVWATADDGLTLKSTSQILNSGNNSYIKGNTDLTGNARIQNGIIDPGAYESTTMITRWYVSELQDTATQNGISWATAFQKFEDGVNAAKPGDTVWVAQGTYTPAANTSFGMKAGVKIFGGFAATETVLAQRSLSLGHNSILNGNNASVLVNSNIDSTATLDGFVIQNGNAAQGAGMLNTNASPTLSNLVFTGNSATGNGGAIANINAAPKLRNAVLYNNTATGQGGAIYNSGSNSVIINSTLCNNTAASGGAIYNNFSSAPVIGNSIFSNNTATTGTDVYSSASATVHYNLLQVSSTGSGNVVSENPFFAAPLLPLGPDAKWFTADDGLQVGYLSPALNSGSNTLAAGISTDITGAVRVQNTTVDMGAYENVSLGFCDSAALNNRHMLYVDAARGASGDGSSWLEAYRTINEALTVANHCTVIDTIFVAKGTYYPTGYQGSVIRTATFSILRSGLYLAGGYPNGGGNRNLTINNTFLNGDIGVEGSAADNSYHVLTFANTGVSGIDGFVITNGNADSILEPFNSGGGIYINGTGGNTPVISNCVFTDNKAAYGAGVYNYGFGNGRNASPVVTNCVFTEDTATIDGGAVYNNGRAGGKASPRFINCTFSRNHAMGKGGVIYDAGNLGNCGTNIANCIMWNNTATAGTAAQKQVYNDAATDTASYTLFQNGVPASVYNAGFNISSAPVFVSDTIPVGLGAQWMSKYNGLALKVNSPGLKAGNPAYAPATDIAGELRQPLPDMGAYQNNGGTGAVVQNATACDSFLSPGYNHMWYTSGVYTDTLFSILGSDTAYQINLTVYHSSRDSVTVTACGSYTSPFGHVYTTNGIYVDSLQTSTGCDSIIVTNLTIKQSSTGNISASVCNTFTSPSGHVWTSSGTYSDTIPNAAGCDSIITIQLTVKQSVTSTVSASICQGSSYAGYTSSGTYTDTYAAANGCDSIRTLTLVVSNTATGADVVNACDSYTWVDGNTYTASNNTATYTYTGGSAGGCDSVVTLNLSINSITTGTDVTTTCSSYTWIDGNTYTASNNTATYTLAGGNMYGCDSIVTLNLTIGTFVPGTDVVTACGSYTWVDGNTYTASNNTATHTIVGGSINGCDSVVTLNLTINSNSTGTDAVTACSSYTWIDGNTYTAGNNTATYTITGGSVNGCDSVVTLNLAINNNATGTDVVTACGSYTWVDGNTYTASNNTATHTIVGGSINGCDSVVTLNLTIKNNTTGMDVVTACGSYNWIDGVTYTVSTNTPTFTLTTPQGCDSVVTLFLTIKNVDVTVVDSDPVLTANATTATYVWLNCDNNYQAIPGATSQSYTLTQNGNYAVQVTQNGCVDTSACYNVTVTGIESEASDVSIQVYPNPSDGLFIVNSGLTETVNIEVTDVLGKLVSNTYAVVPGLNRIDATEWSKGVYFIRMQYGSNVKVERLVLN